MTPRRSTRVVEKMAALPALPPQAAARMPVKTKAKKKTVTAEKKKTPVKIRYDKDGNKIYVNFSDDSRDEDYHLESD